MQRKNIEEIQLKKNDKNNIQKRQDKENQTDIQIDVNKNVIFDYQNDSLIALKKVRDNFTNTLNLFDKFIPLTINKNNKIISKQDNISTENKNEQIHSPKDIFIHNSDKKTNNKLVSDTSQQSKLSLFQTELSQKIINPTQTPRISIYPDNRKIVNQSLKSIPKPIPKPIIPKSIPKPIPKSIQISHSEKFNFIQKKNNSNIINNSTVNDKKKIKKSFLVFESDDVKEDINNQNKKVVTIKKEDLEEKDELDFEINIFRRNNNLKK